MKTKLLILLLSCLLVNTLCQAQFPAPRSFTMRMEYILIGDLGHCCERTVAGPTYCTTFMWEAPDLSETETQLMGYNIYQYYNPSWIYYDGMEIPFSEGVIFAQTTEPYLQMEIGSIGAMWVTAVYSNPEGESELSNIVVNDALPISVKEIKAQNVFLTYNKQKGGIEIECVENITSFSIFCLNGIKILLPEISDFIDTKNLEKGVYIIKITTKDGGVVSDKITIN